MIGAVRVVAGWLTPIMWLMPAALMLGDGPEGLWAALVAALAPLVALLVAGARASDPPPAASRLRASVLVAVVGLLIWANLSLAGDVAARHAIPRWHGVVLAGGPALLALLVRRVAAAPAALLALTLAGLGVPLLAVAQTSGVAPAHAWQTLAGRAAFRFGPGSPSVTDGRAVGAGSRRPVVTAGLTVDEEQRVSAPIGGAIRVHTRDALRDPRQDLKLAPGQSVALRVGDRLEAEPGTRLRFEVGRRVPGAPASGAAWAAGGTLPGPLTRLSLSLTLIGGAVALFAERRFVAPHRATVAVAGAALLAALGWAQAWAVYGALQAPDVFLGGVTFAGVVDVPGLAMAAVGSQVQSLLLLGLLAALAAGSAVLVARPGAGAGGSGGARARDLGLWSLVFAGAGAAALWNVDPWTIALAAFGLGAAAVAPAAILPADKARTTDAMSGVGLAVFVALSAIRSLGVPAAGPVAALACHPVPVAVAAAVALRWTLGRADRA